MAYWNTSVQTFFLPHAELITWLSALKGIIAAFCRPNFVCDENNYIFICYFTYGSLHFLQISAHSKSYTDEVAL